MHAGDVQPGQADDRDSGIDRCSVVAERDEFGRIIAEDIVEKGDAAGLDDAHARPGEHEPAIPAVGPREVVVFASRMRVCRRQFRQAQRTYERNDTTEGPDGDDQPSAIDIVGDDAGKAEYSGADDQSRSEEHTSELQSLMRRSYSV